MSSKMAVVCVIVGSSQLKRITKKRFVLCYHFYYELTSVIDRHSGASQRGPPIGDLLTSSPRRSRGLQEDPWPLRARDLLAYGPSSSSSTSFVGPLFVGHPFGGLPTRVSITYSTFSLPCCRSMFFILHLSHPTPIESTCCYGCCGCCWP